MFVGRNSVEYVTAGNFSGTVISDGTVGINALGTVNATIEGDTLTITNIS